MNRCRKTDVVTRYGGEEFLLFFPDTNAEFAEPICGQIRVAIEKADWSPIADMVGDEFGITISFGVAEVGTDSRRTTILGDADSRLYQAKHSGRNRVRRLASQLQRASTSADVVVPQRRKTIKLYVNR